MPLAKRYCRLCGEPFEPTNNSAKYCSPKCRETLRNFERRGFSGADIESRVCQVCGETFWTLHSSMRQVCGRAECTKQMKKRCQQCGREFAPRRHSQKYCCEGCYRKAKRIIKRERAHGIYRSVDKAMPQTEPTGRKSAHSRVCHDCGKPTDNYRCERCLRRWRLQNGVSQNNAVDEEGYRICRARY